MIAKPLKIAILGAGALGCVFGARLSEAGHDVRLISRTQAQANVLNQLGVTLRSGGLDRRVIVPAISANSHAESKQAWIGGAIDLMIVLVKSFDTDTAMQTAAWMVGEHTVVLSLQNGIGHETILSRWVGAENVLLGKTYVGGFVLAPGLVMDGSAGKDTVIGELGGGVSDRAQHIADVLTQAHLHTTVSKTIQTTIWDKLLANAATGAVSAITGLSYGPLYEQTALAHTAIAAVAEGMAVAKAAGIAISFQEAQQPWLKAGAGLPRDFKPSMLQSLEKGSITEIDFINGAIVELGRQWGVPTPVNATLVACVKAIESKLIISPSHTTE
jgi:2-dehydropantoate 2-reductase